MPSLKRCLQAVLAAVLTICPQLALAQTTVLGENCDLRVLGAQSTKSFLSFDRELRLALSKADKAAVTMLASYPLRINDALGSRYLHDPASLHARFEEVFTPAVREVVINQPTASIFCNYRGIMYGNGTVWVNPLGSRYAVAAVNQRDDAQRQGPSATNNVAFVCRTEDLRVLIDVESTGPRYREWANEKSIMDKPDVEIRGGSGRVEGTGPCAHPTWTFRTSGATYIVEALGCHADSNPPPPGALGTLTVSEHGKSATKHCY